MDARYTRPGRVGTGAFNTMLSVTRAFLGHLLGTGKRKYNVGTPLKMAIYSPGKWHEAILQRNVGSSVTNAHTNSTVH